MRMESRHQGRPRRAAERTVVELREAHAAGGQAVQIRRLDLAAVTAEVGVAQVIGQDQHDVRPLCGENLAGGKRQAEQRGGQWVALRILLPDHRSVCHPCFATCIARSEPGQWGTDAGGMCGYQRVYRDGPTVGRKRRKKEPQKKAGGWLHQERRRTKIPGSPNERTGTSAVSSW